MPLDKITREEFDRRLEQSTKRMRQERVLLEEQAAGPHRRIQEAEAILQRLEIRSPVEGDTRKPAANNRWVQSVAAQFRDDPHYAEADRLGPEWREAQVVEYPDDASLSD